MSYTVLARKYRPQAFEAMTGQEHVVRTIENAIKLVRIKELERENAELRRANEILKTASAFFATAELDRRLR